MNDLVKHNEDNELEDRMNRAGDIKNLTRLIGGMTEPFTLCINASWGAGKTTFVKLWKKALEERGINSIYFSAWEEDFTREPLIALLGEIQGYVDRLKTKGERLKWVMGSFADVATKVAMHAPSTLAKVAMKQVAGIDCSDLIDSVRGQATESIKKYQEDKQIIERFKKLLAQVVAGLAGNKPFVIFIDELDRCRPLYAIEFLERVKHLFGVKGLIFVLSIDKEQLGESIKSQYGNIDTERYFMRFFDLTYMLRNSSVEDFCAGLYGDMLAREPRAKQEGEMNVLLAERLAGNNLREIEQCFKYLGLVVKMDRDYYAYVAYVPEDSRFLLPPRQERKKEIQSNIALRFAIVLVFLMLEYPQLEITPSEGKEWCKKLKDGAVAQKYGGSLAKSISFYPHDVIYFLTHDKESCRSYALALEDKGHFSEMGQYVLCPGEFYLGAFDKVKKDVLLVAELNQQK